MTAIDAPAAALPAPGYPVRTTVGDEPAPGRASVFFRLLLAIPHLVWMTLWSLLVLAVFVVNWLWTLIAGRSPRWAHDFLAAFLRATVHVGAYVLLAAHRYPGFTGEPGYPVDLVVDPPQPQRRLVTFFRTLLAFPMLLLAGAFQYVLLAAATLAWFHCVFTGRIHDGLRRMTVFSLALNVRNNAYVYLLTDRYPPVSEHPFPTS